MFINACRLLSALAGPLISTTLFLTVCHFKQYMYAVVEYGYFNKGCWKKCMRRFRKVWWVVLSSLFFKEIWKNDTRGHGCMFVSAKGKQKSRSDDYSVRNRVLIISHITFQDCPVLIFSDNLSWNSCMWYVLVARTYKGPSFSKCGWCWCCSLDKFPIQWMAH